MKPRWDPINKRWEASLGSGRKRVWFRTKVAGEDGRAIVEAKVKAFVDGPEGCRPGSLAEFLENVWWPIIKQDTTFRTQQTYTSIIDTHFGGLEPVLLSELRLEVLQPWVASLATYTKTDKKGNVTHHIRSPKTIQSIVAVLTSVMELAHKSGRLPHRDHTLVRTPRLTRKTPSSLDSGQIDALLAKCAGTALEGPIWAASYLGLRRGEVCGLKVGHVTIEDERTVIKLQDNRQTHGEESQLKSKAKGEVRTLVMHKSWGEKLLSFAPEGSVYIFCGDHGKPVHPNYLTKKMEHYCGQAKVPRVSFHSLRHSCASNLRAKGVKESVIQTILGHSSIDTTLIYMDGRADEQLLAFGRQASKG